MKKSQRIKPYTFAIATATSQAKIAKSMSRQRYQQNEKENPDSQQPPEDLERLLQTF
tara:strand:- start:969 stop:1139 length:171 start_codon:yes stop_codon:yes gene_type:complete